MTAVEAKKITADNRLKHSELPAIYEKIKGAAQIGKTDTHVFKLLHEATIEQLQKDGYVIEDKTDYIMGGATDFKISWE
jgi:hypothetical protein